MTSTRKPAFDPTRLDTEIDDLLAPPPPTAIQMSTAATNERSTPHATPPPVGEKTARAGRGSGGRPGSGARQQSAAELKTAVRIPKPLYDTVVHDLLGTSVERPSYAQVIAWTCEDHRDDVLAELAHAVKAGRREPRGRKLATDGVPLTLRFTADEREVLDDILREASGATARITRTAGVIAALRVAVKHGANQAAAS